jgi:DNA anti-recombination protein RmuC
VLKDVETRKQVHVIQQELGRLAKDFGLFEDRMTKLATHIRQAHEDVEQVNISSRKISNRFREIERVELTGGPLASDPGADYGRAARRAGHQSQPSAAADAARIGQPADVRTLPCMATQAGAGNPRAPR